MADPLSIAASIIGIAAAAAKVGGFLSTFISSTAEAPNSAASALASVQEMQMTLFAIQPLMDSLHALPSSRRSLIQLDHLSVIITHSVLTISELESIVCCGEGLLSRLQWAVKEKRVLGLLPRLDSQKCSLALMVSILRSESDIHARKCQDQLLSKVDEILQQNNVLVERLQSLEGQLNPGAPSVKFLEDSASLVSYRRLSIQSVRSVANSTLSTARRESALAISRFSVISKKNFELALAKSRVYTRAVSDESDMSFTTSTAPTNAWSMLSGLSLNDISVVSAFRLPLNLEDIDYFAPGSSTFANLLTQQLASHEVQPGSISCGHNVDTGIHVPVSERHRDMKWRASILVASPLHLKSSRNPSTTGSMKIVLIGDKNALKSEMLHTYLNPKRNYGVTYIPPGQDSFNVVASFNKEQFEVFLQDTTGQESYHRLRVLSYSNTDIFLILSNQDSDEKSKSVKEVWLPEISSHCPDTPCIVVRTHKRKPSPSPPALANSDQADPPSVSLNDGSRTVKQVCCDVRDARNVRTIFGQAIVAALKDHQNQTNLRDFLKSWNQKRRII